MIRKIVEVIHRSVGGLDVHKETVVACRRRLIEEGQAEVEIKTFKTTTSELKGLVGWLRDEWQVTHVAMESTGVYWIPVWNILEGHFKLLLANAHYVKKVPGRKDDQGDAEWLAQCMQCGMLRNSFVPSEQIRQWRHLTRQRAKLADQHTAVVNRVHAVLQQANIKLATVASDIMGVSCRMIIGAMIKGEKNPNVLAALALGRLKAKREDLIRSLDGSVNEHHRWLLRRLMRQLKGIEDEMAVYSTRIETQMGEYQYQLDLLDTIPGVGQCTAENILAEIGPHMSQFPTDDDLVSWAGICPGKNESAGKKRSSKITKGNSWLKRALVESAWAAVCQKDTYLSALYRRLAPRRGKKRALIAVARTILQAAWHILTDEVEYRELGGGYFEHLNEGKTKAYLVKRLQRLGFEVQLKRRPAA